MTTANGLAKRPARWRFEPVPPEARTPPRELLPATRLSAPATRPALLERVAAAIRARHYSPRTEEAYSHWIKRFIVFHNLRDPTEAGEREIGRFLSHLATAERVAASTQNQALNALLFLTDRYSKRMSASSRAEVDPIYWTARAS